MDNRRIADYFVVAGLPDRPTSSAGLTLRQTTHSDPIVDLAVINRSLGETPPEGFHLIETTPSNYPADLNYGSLISSEMYLCFRRGRHKPPLTDIGVMYERLELAKPGVEVLYETPYGRSANVNNTNGDCIFVTYSRADTTADMDRASVINVCVIIPSKGEKPPHAFHLINKTLNRGMLGTDVFLCYKKAPVKSRALYGKAELIGRYPFDDYPEIPLPQQVSMFCLPLGATIEHWAPESRYPLPIFSTFVLTGETGERLYGGSVIFYEDFPADRLRPEHLNQLGLVSAHQAPRHGRGMGEVPAGSRDGYSGSGTVQSKTLKTETCAANAELGTVDGLARSEGLKVGRAVEDNMEEEASGIRDFVNDESETENAQRSMTDGSVGGISETKLSADDSSGASVAEGLSTTDSLAAGGVETRWGDTDPPPRPVMLHQNKAIALLSRWPFFETFKKILFYLYRISVSGPQPIPIERYIAHYLTELPFPSYQSIHIQLSTETVMLPQIEDSPLPKSGASYVKLLGTLGADGCVSVLLCALLEHRILLHSVRPDVLTSISEAVANMIFPLRWQCPYIPLCPAELFDVLDTPTPFIFGLDSRYFIMYDPPSDITFVDLDTSNVTVSDERSFHTTKLLPKKAVKDLRTILERYFDVLREDFSNPDTPDDLDHQGFYSFREFSGRRKMVQLEVLIQEAFLRFMAAILGGYDAYLKPIMNAPTDGTTDLYSLFNVEGFLKSRGKANSKFYTSLLLTQAFSRFIEERSFAFDGDTGFAFFDECVEKVNSGVGGAECRLLVDPEESSQSGRAVYVVPPESAIPPPGQPLYTFDGFGDLKPERFLHPQQQQQQQGGLGRSRGSSTTTGTLDPVRFLSGVVLCRTKQELKASQRVVLALHCRPRDWIRCIAWQGYSLWFMLLPAYLSTASSKTRALHSARAVLQRTLRLCAQTPDEVHYRILLHLCGLCGEPALAVRVLLDLQHERVTPNAKTYAFYNKIVLETKWPSSSASAAQQWTKLRNTVRAVAQFKSKPNGAASKPESHHQGPPLNVSPPEAADWSSVLAYNTTEQYEVDGQLKSAVPLADPNADPTTRFTPYRHTDGTESLQENLKAKNQRVEARTGNGRVVCDDNSPGLNSSSNTPNRNGNSTPQDLNSSFSNFGMLRSFRDSLRRNLTPVLAEMTHFAAELGSRGELDDSLNRGDGRSGTVPLALTDGSPAWGSGLAEEELSIELKIHPHYEQFVPRPEELPVDPFPPLSRWRGSSKKSSHKSAPTAASLEEKEKENARQRNDPDLDTDMLKTVDPTTGNKSEISRAAEPHQNSMRSEREPPLEPSVKFERSSQHARVSLDYSGGMAGGDNYDNRCKTLPLQLQRLRREEKARAAAVALPRAGSTGSVYQSPGGTLAQSAQPTTIWARTARYLGFGSSDSGSSRSEFLEGEGGRAETMGSRGSSLESLGSAGGAGGAKRRVSRAVDTMDGGMQSTGGGRGGDGKLSFSGSSSQLLDRLVPAALPHDSRETDSSFDDSEQSYDGFLSPLRGASLRGGVGGGERGSGKVLAEVEMSSESKCSNCANLMYDDEIMAGWSEDDSNLNILCLYCGVAFVPRLQIDIKRFKCAEEEKSPDVTERKAERVVDFKEECTDDAKTDGKMERTCEQNEMGNAKANRKMRKCKEEEGPSVKKAAEEAGESVDGVTCESVSVQYLSPGVLRKEVENVVQQRGEACLLLLRSTEDAQQGNLVDDHAAVFWNLVWLFKRLRLQSHIHGFILRSKSCPDSSPPAAPAGSDGTSKHPPDSRQVVVRTLWDGPHTFASFGYPMHLQYSRALAGDPIVESEEDSGLIFDKQLLDEIVSYLREDDVMSSMQLYLTARSSVGAAVSSRASPRTPGKGAKRRSSGLCRSMYRELSFLVRTALGRDYISRFDNQYRVAYESLRQTLTLRGSQRMMAADRPQDPDHTCFRRQFAELDLVR